MYPPKLSLQDERFLHNSDASNFYANMFGGFSSEIRI